MQRSTLYLDMDGVLCDFDEQCRRYFTDIEPNEDIRAYKARTGSNKFWSVLRCTQGEFWTTMPPMRPDIGDVVKDLSLRYDVCILTSPDRLDTYCIPGKLAWINQHLGSDIRVIFEKEKHIHVKAPTDILLDDLPKQIDGWIKAGGVGMLFTGWEVALQNLQI